MKPCPSIQPGVTLLSDFCRDCDHAVAAHDRFKVCSICKNVEDWHERLGMVFGVNAQHRPQRGDAVEAWIKKYRDGEQDENDNRNPHWYAIDELLDAYRLAADTGEVWRA